MLPQHHRLLLLIILLVWRSLRSAGSRHSVRLHGASVRRSRRAQDGGAAILSRPLDHASLHARAGVRGPGCRGGRGEGRACAPGGRGCSSGVVFQEHRPVVPSPSGSNAELSPTNCGLLASSPNPVGTMTPTTTAIPGPVSMHLPDGRQLCQRAEPGAQSPQAVRTAPLAR